MGNCVTAKPKIDSIKKQSVFYKIDLCTSVYIPREKLEERPQNSVEQERLDDNKQQENQNNEKLFVVAEEPSTSKVYSLQNNVSSKCEKEYKYKINTSVVKINKENNVLANTQESSVFNTLEKSFTTGNNSSRKSQGSIKEFNLSSIPKILTFDEISQLQELDEKQSINKSYENFDKKVAISV